MLSRDVSETLISLKKHQNKKPPEGRLLVYKTRVLQRYVMRQFFDQPRYS